MLVDWLVIGSLPFWLITVGIVGAIIAAVENERGLWATVCVVAYLAALHLAGGVDMLLWARTHVEWIAGGLLGYLVLGAVWGVAKWYFFTKKKAVETEENYRQARKDFLLKGIVHPDDAPRCAPEQQHRGVFVRIGEFLYGNSAPTDSTGKPLRRLNVPDATEETSVPAELKAAWNEILQQGYYTMGRIELRLTPPRPNDHKSMITMWMSFWPASLFWTLLNDPIRAAFRHIYASLVRTLQDISNRAFSHVADMRAQDTKVDTPPPSSNSGTASPNAPIPPGSSTPDVPEKISL